MNERPQAPGRIDVAAIARSERFAAGINALARELGRSEAELRSEALAFLNELRTAHSPRVHSWVVRAGRALCRMGYERIDYDPEQLAVVRPLMQRCPSVVLASHRSYLDGGALTVGFHDHFLPPLVVFAGINMAFWPVGSIWRLANNVFIRRGSAGPVYKFVLRHYLGALLEGDRHLQWFIEGTRSRTGRLGRPRLGLLVYVLEAWLEGHADDVVLLPTSVAYDQLRDVEEYAREARGESKQKETLGWLVQFVRGQRGRFGSIYVRFAEPIVVRDVLSRDAPLTRPAVEQLAREVLRRAGLATPVTGAALVAIVLLGTNLPGLTLAQVVTGLEEHLAYARSRNVPLAATADLRERTAVTGVLDSLVAQGLVARSTDDNPVYAVVSGQEVALAFYRNTVLHFFLAPAVAQLALLGAIEAPAGERVARFEQEVDSLLDLLSGDFFLDARDLSLSHVEAELSRDTPEWRGALLGEGAALRRWITQLAVPGADMTLKAYFEALAVVARQAEQRVDVGVDAAAFEHACLDEARERLSNGTLRRAEAAAPPWIRSAIAAVADRGLLDPDESRRREREVFREWCNAVLGRIDVLAAATQQRLT